MGPLPAGELARLVAGAAACALLPPGAAGLATLTLALAGRRARARGAEGRGGGEGGEPAPPVNLEWRGLSLRVGREVEKVVLHSCAGRAGPGELTAVLGPSGAGKTSLLCALAGRVPRSKGARLEGHIGAQGLRRGDAVGWVPQDDVFYSQLTVQETLEMKVALQAPRLDDEQRKAYVETLLTQMGLGQCADSRVGDRKTRGISGGEKKRLSVACELVKGPQLLFADEPTTGLDSFQAEQVAGRLKSIASEGKTVIATIHQPRGSIFEKFDNVVLLFEGGVVYSGPADEALRHFAKLGFPCPKGQNPAEFLVDLISVDFSSPENEAQSRARIGSLEEAFRKGLGAELAASGPQGSTVSAQSLVEARAPVATQVLWLLKRSWKQISRDKITNRIRLSVNINSAIVFGSIFFQMTRKQSTIQDRFGLLQVAAINTAMASLTKTCQIFPTEKCIVAEERAGGAYNVAPYLASKLAAELPISAAFPLAFGCIVYPLTGLQPGLGRFMRFLSIVTLESFASSALGLTVGSVAPSPEAAAAMGPAIMVIFIVFGGYYVNPDNVPKALRWVPQASLIRWAFQALCINEFSGLTFDVEKKGDIATGEQALERLSFSGGVNDALLAKARIVAVNYWCAYSLLKSSAPKFLELEEPTA